jgi:hypothetical protein
MVVGGPGNADLRNWEQIAVQLPTHSLQPIRDAARSWATTLSALVGISTVIGLVQGRDSFSKLASGTQIAFAVALFVTLAAAVVAIYSAGIASQGKPYRGWNDARSIRDWYNKEVDNAVASLKRSWFLSGVAVVALVVAILINWFGPVQPNAGMSVLVVQKLGSVVCGTLQKDKAGNLVLSNDGQPSISLNDITSITVVSSCP